MFKGHTAGQAGAPEGGGKKQKKPKTPRPTVLPELKDKDGNLRKLKGSAFPATPEGKALFCDYQIAKWTAKKVRVLAKKDPKAKKVAKIESLKKKLAALEAEVAGTAGAAGAAEKK